MTTNFQMAFEHLAAIKETACSKPTECMEHHHQLEIAVDPAGFADSDCRIDEVMNEIQQLRRVLEAGRRAAIDTLLVSIEAKLQVLAACDAVV